ncbi:MAG: hypothetical protein GY913_12430 [Proteobacteria bacterium]|nr:hypothetical protein [Pseudomonadota bacterium]
MLTFSAHKLPASAPEPTPILESSLQFLDGPEHSVSMPTALVGEEVALHSFREHQDALAGPAFDPVHLFQRSAIPRAAVRGEEQSVAAILKARHDLAFWTPMVEHGLADMFSGHLRDLYAALDLLERFPPRRAVLRPHWEDARAALVGALPRATKAA